MKAVILAGGCDFGRSELTASLPTALWPVAGKPALERLLDSLAEQGMAEAVVCSNGQSSMLAESHVPPLSCQSKKAGPMKVEFRDETLPVGTAGAIRDAARGDKESVFFIFPAAIVCPPKIEVLLSAHRQGESNLTVMFNPGCGPTPRGESDQAVGDACGIYVCSGSVLEHIPKAGYCDIKEGLIPEMLRAGKTVHAAVLPNHAGNFRDRREYLDAIGDCLQKGALPETDLKNCERKGSQNVWIGADVRVHSTARICEPVIIMDGVSVADGAVIIGPAVLGRNVSVGKDAVVAGSVIWDGAHLGPNCRVQRCLIGRGAVVRPNAVLEEESVSFRREGVLMVSIKSISEAARKMMGGLKPMFTEISRKMPNWTTLRLSRRVGLAPPNWWAEAHPTGRGGTKRPIVILGVSLLLIAFLWSYWPELTDLWGLWQRSDEYSSGLLVPFLAVYVLWTRRHDLAQCEIRPSVLWGLLAFLGAQAFRQFGLFFMYDSAERLSVVLSLGALVLLLFGWRILGKAFTTLLFLFLMVPWPTGLQGAIAQPLQRWATSSAVFCLETAGYDVVRQGNIIDIGGTAVAVAEACNGLRMVTAFFVISGLVVLLIKRPLWEKIVVFASSLPIALLCNTVRLTITAMAFTVLDGEQWEKIFHDFGGYAMMPLAIAIVVAELWLLRKLTTAPTQQETIVITRQDK
jgi:exosortase